MLHVTKITNVKNLPQVKGNGIENFHMFDSAPFYLISTLRCQ